MSKPDPSRVVAGLACSEVLADLSAYLDAELAPERVARIEAHLQGCDWCERFGGEFAAVVGGLRRTLAEPAPAPSDLIARLRSRLTSRPE